MVTADSPLVARRDELVGGRPFRVVVGQQDVDARHGPRYPMAVKFERAAVAASIRY